MRVTKFPQSCLKIEKDGKSLMIDIGIFVSHKYELDELEPIDAVLITHQHADHLDEDFVTRLYEKQVPVYGNQDVADKLSKINVTVVADNQDFNVAGFAVTAVELPHCKMVDGSDGPPNTGFLIDSAFIHPGDSIENKGLEVQNAAVPVAGPSISLKDAVDFARALNAKNVIPIHFSNPVFFNDPNTLKERFTDANVIVLSDGESTEL